MTKFIERFQFTPAVLVLIGMNLIPLVGVFWFGWDAGTIVFLYWLENVIIGFLNIPKILSCQGLNIKPMTAHSRRPHKNTISKRLFLSLFFSIHYGVFCLVHYIFLQAFFTQMPNFEVLLPALIDSVLFWSLLGLAFSHLMSMAVNFYGKGEYKTRAPREQMKLPYPRIMVLHIVILAGAGLVIAYGQTAIMLALLVLIKIGFDLSAHLVEHSEKERSPISSVS